MTPRSVRLKWQRLQSPGLMALLCAAALLLLAACSDDTPAAATSAAPAAPTDATATEAATATPSGTVAQLEPLAGSLAELVERVRPSVVLIEGNSQFGTVSGTGVVIDRDGHILTNFHVVDGQRNLKVSLPDGSASRAELVGADAENDLAVIRASDIPDDALRPATLGDSDLVRAGDDVFAIGNPFSQDFSVTAGIISATNRSWSAGGSGRAIHGVLQTDAALNHGNSGGPLFNMRGEVIGINTAIHNPEGGVFAGIGFAVASNTARRYLPQMIAGETIQHPQLGVMLEELDEVRAAEFGSEVTRGLYVTGVTPGSAAERAGLIVGDVIVEVNGEPSQAFWHLGQAIDRSAVGDEITIRIFRGAQEQTVRATLQPWDLQ